jgi:hypothetical protein
MYILYISFSAYIFQVYGKITRKRKKKSRLYCKILKMLFQKRSVLFFELIDSKCFKHDDDVLFVPIRSIQALRKNIKLINNLVITCSYLEPKHLRIRTIRRIA